MQRHTLDNGRERIRHNAQLGRPRIDMDRLADDDRAEVEWPSDGVDRDGETVRSSSVWARQIHAAAAHPERVAADARGHLRMPDERASGAVARAGRGVRALLSVLDAREQPSRRVDRERSELLIVIRAAERDVQRAARAGHRLLDAGAE